MISLRFRGHDYTTRMGMQLRVTLIGTRAVGIVHWRYKTGEGMHNVEYLGDVPFDGCRCNGCTQNEGRSKQTRNKVEKLLELTHQLLETSTRWASGHEHCMWHANNGSIRVGYGARAALWDRSGSTYRKIGGAQAFQRALVCLAGCNQVLGDIHSTKAMTSENKSKRTRPDETADSEHSIVPLRDVQSWSI